MMATELSPIASRNTTKRVRVPELSGTDASLAIAERVDGVVAKARHRLGLDGDDMRARTRPCRRRDIGDQHRRQALRQFDELDRAPRPRPAGSASRARSICGIGDQRQDGIRVVGRR